jgi:hypothetical protein
VSTYKKHKISKEQLLKTIAQGEGINETARRLGTYPQLIRKMCAELNISSPNRKITRHDHNEVYMMYLDKGKKATAEHYGYNIATIYWIARTTQAKMYGPWRTASYRRRRLDWDAVYEMRKTKSPSETARHFNATITAIRHITKSFGIPPQSNGRSKSYDHDKIYKAHLEHGSPEAAKIIGCCYNTVRLVVNRIEREIAMSESDQPNGKTKARCKLGMSVAMYKPS